MVIERVGRGCALGSHGMSSGRPMGGTGVPGAASG